MAHRLRGAAVLAVVLAVVACSTKQGSSSTEMAASPDDAWQVLFDGTAVHGLRGYGLSAVPEDRWVIEGGELRTVPGTGIDLISDVAFGDFELEFEWRVAPGGNSGVLYRVRETEKPAWTSGPEYQLLDDAGHPDGANPATSAGALYDLIPPGPAKRLQPVGSFNASRIVVRDDHVEHWLNGERVVEYGLHDPDVAARVAASKFARLDGFMRERTGAIVFQHHGEEAAFRAIRVRPLDGP